MGSLNGPRCRDYGSARAGSGLQHAHLRLPCGDGGHQAVGHSIREQAIAAGVEITAVTEFDLEIAHLRLPELV